MLPTRGSPAVAQGEPPRRADVENREALRALFEWHFAYVWRLLRRLGVHEAATDDATQQVFMVVAKRLSAIRPGSEKAFLTSTAVRVASNYRRTFARRPEVADSNAVDEAAHPSSNPETLLERRRERLLLDRALDQMPDDLRAVLVLSELEDLTNPEIARLLELPLGTVASRLRRARSTFRTIAETLRQRYEDDHGF